MERAVIVDGARTPFGRSGGELANQQSFELAGLAMRKLVEDVDPADIDELLLGVGIVGSGAIAPARRALHGSRPAPRNLLRGRGPRCCSGITAISLASWS
jgi:acetyl-CoA C-acetyltransferase